MALRDQPYLPLYIQDFLTDEKLIECNAETTGVYIRLMCLMHKSEEYGKILLKQKDKQTDNQIQNFACKLSKQMPYELEPVVRALTELVGEKVLILDGDYLIQKRMVADNELSLKRSVAGRKGGSFAQAKVKATTKANAENEIAIEYEVENGLINNEGGVGETETPIQPPRHIDQISSVPKHKNEAIKTFDRKTLWFESLKMCCKPITLDEGQIVNLMDEFITFCNATGKNEQRPEQEIKKHFTNWLKKKHQNGELKPKPKQQYKKFNFD